MSAIAFMSCYVFTLSTSIQAQTTKADDEVKLGLVLSGGGARGFAHIGVLKVFEEEDIPISIITGNSIGAIVGALYSIGYSAQDIEDFVRKQDWEMLLTDDMPRKLKSPFKQNFEQKYLLQLSLNSTDKKLSLPSGFVKGNNIMSLFSGVTANIPDSIQFSELPIPFACVAYNLETGKEEVLNHGYLPKAMLASMAIPGAFSPVNFNGMHLVDGGIINNFPVDVAKDMGANIIIGVDLKQDKSEDSQFESISSILMGIVDQIEIEKHDENVELADVVINPMLEEVSLFDFKTESIDSIMKMGEIAAREQLPKIKELIAGRNIERNNKNIGYDHNNEWLIKDIIIPENYNNHTRFINSRLELMPNTTYTTDEIEQATKRLFAFGNFELVNYKLYKSGGGHNLELFIEDKKEEKVMFGAALNTIDVAALYANYSKQNYSNLISFLTIDAKVSVNPQLKLKLETHRMLSSLGLEMSVRYNELDVYHDGNKSGKMDILNASATLYTYRRIHNVVDMGLELSQRYYNNNAYSNTPGNLFQPDGDGFYTSVNGYFTIDSRDNANITNRGLYLNSRLSLLINKGDFSNIIPIYFFKLKSTISIGKDLSILTNLYHRSIFNANTHIQSSAFVNYASNPYNAYSDYSFPVLGQRGITFLEPISTLVEIGLRISLVNNNFLIPRFQTLSQFDNWENPELRNVDWSAGITYQSATNLGPIDFTLGYQNKSSDFSFFGGVGYQF